MRYKDIILRSPAKEDLDLLYKWENYKEIWQVSNTHAPYSREEIRQHIEDCSIPLVESGQARYMICRLSDSTALGTIDIFDFDPIHHRAGIGILIADESNRRKGYARMALEALIEYCFKKLRLHQVYCNILADNIASISLFEGAGFTCSGTKKDWVKTENGYQDELYYQLIAPR